MEAKILRSPKYLPLCSKGTTLLIKTVQVLPTNVPKKENKSIIINIMYSDLTSKKMKMGNKTNKVLDINAFIIKLFFLEPMNWFIREEKI
jgi:hypothetical protein